MGNRMDVKDIAQEHRSGRRISRGKITWLLNELENEQPLITKQTARLCIDCVEGWEDTEEIVEELKNMFDI